MTTPVLYHCPQTRANTTLWMNEELGSPCQVELVDIRANAQKSPEYLAKNPMGKVPALVHDGVCITEAGAICAYLADLMPECHLAPAHNSPHRGTYFRWMFFASACIEPAMMDTMTGVERDNGMSAGHGVVADVLTTIDHALETSPYLLGENFSAADVVFGSTLNFALMFGAFEKTDLRVAYTERIMSRPAAQRADALNAEFSERLGWT